MASVAPLSQVVLKVHSRCDLACDHCYVYEAVDQSWRGRPMVISADVVVQAARRIAEHVGAHALPEVSVVLHGGEPLLAGRDRLERIITELRRALDGGCHLDLRIHTNGVRLTAELCELFAAQHVKVGISVDGDKVANDRHRRYADGRSSYSQVLRAIELLAAGPFRELYAGLLCTIDVANDPLVVYESLMALRPPRIDFLLPHATWNHPPARKPGADHEYAAWLTAIYDRWLADDRPAEIRTFDSIISTLRGGDSLTEALGLGPTGLVVIETDGSYEQVDSLKVAYEGAPETGLNVFSHSLDLVAEHPGITAREQGIAGLCRTCRECPVVGSCGGGLYTHRYRDDGSRFDNPSVYCPDLLRLISHISVHQPGRRAAAPERPPHAISAASFAGLAGGLGDAAAIASLVQAQRSLIRAVLTALYQAAMTSPAVAEPVRAQLRAAWSVLSAVDRDRPDALAVVLGHPYLRDWAVHCLERLRAAWRPGAADPTPVTRQLATDLDHLSAVAAAAAARSRLGGAIKVPIVSGAVHLPTLGRLMIGPEPGLGGTDHEPGTASVSVISNAVIIQAGDSCWTLRLPGLLAGQADAVPAAGNRASGDWQPVRMLRARGWCLALEDTDPYRGRQRWPAASRLTGTEVAAWQHVFRLAWQQIEREYPAYAPGLAAGLTMLTPLEAAPDGRPAGATSQQAFGAIAASPTADPAVLAQLFMEEFQRAKLGAILDLFDLYDPSDDRLFQMPWGEEKAEVSGLLQGAYLHLASTDFWRIRRQGASGPAARAAGRRFAEWRAQTQEAIDTLLNSGALTELGQRFVREMGRSAARWPA
jgi:uncharacterized protein